MAWVGDGQDVPSRVVVMVVVMMMMVTVVSHGVGCCSAPQRAGCNASDQGQDLLFPKALLAGKIMCPP